MDQLADHLDGVLGCGHFLLDELADHHTLPHGIAGSSHVT
jgi:hypothetical protein